jgi:cbb3-type cytochrome oxidase subunit 1
MALGMVMGAQSDFTYAPVHAHLNLLGFVAIMLYGLTYKACPNMANGRLASIHFYMVNLGVILMIPSLALLMDKNTIALPALLAGEILTIASLLIFFVNLWLHRKD